MISTITMKDGTQIYYKDWGTGKLVVFSHGWPLSADSWEVQMVFLAKPWSSLFESAQTLIWLASLVYLAYRARRDHLSAAASAD